MPNGVVESFNGRLGEECLNEQLFRSYRHTREIFEDWRIDYNLKRSHSNLEGLTSKEFKTRSAMENDMSGTTL